MQRLIGLYLGQGSVGSTFGAAGALLVFLIWVYYSAQILFFGAELTQVYARRFGSRITPSKGAVPLTAEARVNQGMPHQEALERASAEPSGERLPERVSAMAAVQSNEGAVAGYAGGRAAGGHVNGTKGRSHASRQANGTARAVASQDGSGNGTGSTGKRPKGSGGTKGAPDAVKKAMWAGLVAGSMAAGAVAARRASAGTWRGVFHEEPPTKNV